MSYRKQVQRFKGGFLFGQHPLTQNRSSEWEYHSYLRPLVFCHLQVHFTWMTESLPHLVVHPILLATPYVSLTQMLPLRPGTPIILLPHGTPAYYHTIYAGPTTTLIKQFKGALRGLGVSNWENIFNGDLEHGASDGSSIRGDNTRGSLFIIAQITVENKQGADKGFLVIYPTALCLSFVPSINRLYQPFEHMLKLPAPLQASPQAQSVVPDSTMSTTRPSSPLFVPFKPISGIGNPLKFLPAPGCTNSPTNGSLQAFRSLTVSKFKDIYRVADEVGSYVEFVAREREKEREKLKREREGATFSPRLTRAVAPIPPAAPPTASTVVDTPEPQPSTSTTEIELVPSPQQAPPPHSFYPSPPHANAINIGASNPRTSPVATSSEVRPVTPVPSMHTGQNAPGETIQCPSFPGPSDDPFGNMNSSWPQSSQTYMDIGMDFDMSMSFGMSMDTISGPRNGSDAYIDLRSSMDFEDAFTEDDFSFFDSPSRTTGPSAIRTALPRTPILNTQSLNLQTEPSLPPKPATITLGNGATLPALDKSSSGLGPPLATTSTRPLDNNAEGLIHGFAVLPETKIPDLSPTSPGQTPETDSGPATPDIQLDCNERGENYKTSHPASPFDPIPFAPYHRRIDGKYLHGKFSVFNPPSEDYWQETISSSPSCSSGDTGSWKLRYNAITDPRISVVRKLIGVKRKLASKHSPRENFKFSKPWTNEQDSWANDWKSDGETRSEDESEDGEVDEIDSAHDISRPATPPPSYLPLGPTLVCTYFEHALLLPIGTSMSSADASHTTAPNAAAPISVPTPVSPAATLGAVTEKSRSLQAVAHTVAAEVVENNVWGETWKAMALLPSALPEAWPADVKYASVLLESISTSECAINMSTLFEFSPASPSSETGCIPKPLDSPMVTVGKGDAIVNVFPTALRFWGKLGLGPRGGKKNLMAFVLYDNQGDGNQRELRVESWLADIAVAYAARHYGSLEPAHSPACMKDGHLVVKYDTSIRKALTSFVSSLPSIDKCYVFFLVIPNNAMTLASPVLRQSISGLKKALKDKPSTRVVLELIPEQQIFGSLQTPSYHELSINSICSSVYNRVPSIVARATSHQPDNSDIRGYIEEPAFTLARSLPYKASFTRAAHASLDVMDRHTFMHVGYQLSSCGKWLLAACIDQRGEAHDLGIWLTHNPGEIDEAEITDEVYTVKKIWEFALSFAKKANVEWRMVITKLGNMGETELDAWMLLLAGRACNRSILPFHISLLCAEAEAPWSIVDVERHSSKPQMTPNRAMSMKNVIFTDVSSQTYIARSKLRHPISLPVNLPPTQFTISEPASRPTYLSTETTAENVGSKSSEDREQLPDAAHPLTLLPRSSITLIRIPASAPAAPTTMLHVHLLYSLLPSSSNSSYPDETKIHEEIAHNFYELALLAKSRWDLSSNPILPFHLGAVEAMRVALERDKFDVLSEG
ncbi:hypothetical protein AX17_006039 [Amanita inopinata Kibby_2008]|nr:hypothetical protein AX17_006039 [Amanita inopinata Kibby_2008]